MKLKQIFCKHVWKITDTNILSSILEPAEPTSSEIIMGLVPYTQDLALYRQCVKCDKNNVAKIKHRSYEDRGQA